MKDLVIGGGLGLNRSNITGSPYVNNTLNPQNGTQQPNLHGLDDFLNLLEKEPQKLQNLIDEINGIKTPIASEAKKEKPYFPLDGSELVNDRKALYRKIKEEQEKQGKKNSFCNII